MKDYSYEVQHIRDELLKYITSNKIESLVMGISGGIDSALCAVLAKPVCDSLKIPLIGRSLPIQSNKQEEINRAKSVGENFCTNFLEINLGEDFTSLWNTLDKEDSSNFPNKFQFRRGNLKARLRMIYLYDIAQLHNGLILSTDNYTEYLLGFWTLHGDVGDFGMIQNLWKTEVYEMSEWLVEKELDKKGSIALKECIECQATDGLGITNTDLDQILPGWGGSSKDGYKMIDEILKTFLSLNSPDIDTKNPVIIRHKKSAFKRNNPFNIFRNLIIKNE
jgi:NAD+ synthase